jgi:hypothetical protein
MRIKLKRNETDGHTDVIIIDAVEHEGEVFVAFHTSLMPVIEIEEGVQGEVFLPSTVELFDAKDHEKLAPRPELSVWRGKVPDYRR